MSSRGQGRSVVRPQEEFEDELDEDRSLLNMHQGTKTKQDKFSLNSLILIGGHLLAVSEMRPPSLSNPLQPPLERPQIRTALRGPQCVQLEVVVLRVPKGGRRRLIQKGQRGRPVRQEDRTHQPIRTKGIPLV